MYNWWNLCVWVDSSPVSTVLDSAESMMKCCTYLLIKRCTPTYSYIISWLQYNNLSFQRHSMLCLPLIPHYTFMKFWKQVTEGQFCKVVFTGTMKFFLKTEKKGCNWRKKIILSARKQSEAICTGTFLVFEPEILYTHYIHT